jgi:hypothetical protein
MSDMYDQPARQPGSGATSASAGDAPASETTSATEATHRYVPRPAPGYDDVDTRAGADSGAAVGLTLLAAAIMMIAGIVAFFEGLAGVIRGTFYVVLPHYAFNLSATGWGILNICIGAIVFLVGAALLTGNTIARMVAVVIAGASAIANFVWLPYYPVWAIVVIALDIFVIWALLTPRNPLNRGV